MSFIITNGTSYCHQTRNRAVQIVDNRSDATKFKDETTAQKLLARATKKLKGYEVVNISADNINEKSSITPVPAENTVQNAITDVKTPAAKKADIPTRSESEKENKHPASEIKASAVKPDANAETEKVTGSEIKNLPTTGAGKTAAEETSSEHPSGNTRKPRRRQHSHKAAGQVQDHSAQKSSGTPVSIPKTTEPASSVSTPKTTVPESLVSMPKTTGPESSVPTPKTTVPVSSVSTSKTTGPESLSAATGTETSSAVKEAKTAGTEKVPAENISVERAPVPKAPASVPMPAITIVTRHAGTANKRIDQSNPAENLPAESNHAQPDEAAEKNTRLEPSDQKKSADENTRSKVSDQKKSVDENAHSKVSDQKKPAGGDARSKFSDQKKPAGENTRRETAALVLPVVPKFRIETHKAGASHQNNPSAGGHEAACKSSTDDMSTSIASSSVDLNVSPASSSVDLSVSPVSSSVGLNTLKREYAVSKEPAISADVSDSANKTVTAGKDRLPKPAENAEMENTGNAITENTARAENAGKVVTENTAKTGNIRKAPSDEVREQTSDHSKPQNAVQNAAVQNHSEAQRSSHSRQDRNHSQADFPARAEEKKGPEIKPPEITSGENRESSVRNTSARSSRSSRYASRRRGGRGRYRDTDGFAADAFTGGSLTGGGRTNDEIAENESNLKEVRDDAGHVTHPVPRRYFTQRERNMIYNSTEGHCGICGRFIPLGEYTIDHIIPLSKGGTNDLSNLQPCCSFCNKAKDDSMGDEFFERIERIYLYQAQLRYSKKKFKKLNKALKSLKDKNDE